MTSSPPSIVRIDGFELSATLAEPVGNSRQMFDRRTTLLLRVTAADGSVGWGEAWAYPGAAGALAREVFGPALIGRDALAPRPAWAAMAARLGYDRRGISIMTIGGLDMALWDLAGHILDRPLHALLGGALRDRLPVYASGPFLKPGPDPYRDTLRDVEGYLDRGFRAIKLRLGTEPIRDGAVAAEVRARVGAAMPLMVDLNEGFTVAGAGAIAERLADVDLVWLEEPIAHDDFAGYRRLAARSPIPLAGGEALVGLGAYRDWVAEGIFDFVQPDLAICGGFCEAMRIAALCDAFGVAVLPHVWGSIVNFHAALHFAACLPERRGRLRAPLFEYDPSENPLRTAFGEHPLDADGAIAVPDGPGLGLDLSPDRFEPWLVGHWTIS